MPFLSNGQAIQVPNAPNQGWVKLLAESGEFIGVGEVLDDGRIAPRRLVNNSQ